jgi:hypothetical protein
MHHTLQDRPSLWEPDCCNERGVKRASYKKIMRDEKDRSYQRLQWNMRTGDRETTL